MTRSRSSIGRRNRQKGAEFEREVVKVFKDAGLSAERIKGSGAHASGHNDVIVQDTFQVECKRKSDGWGQIYKWLDQENVNIVALRSDRKRPLAVIDLDWLADVLAEVEGKN